MTLSNWPEIPIISSLSELEWKLICWTFFAGRHLKTNERSNTRNTIQLPELHKVVRGKLEAIFYSEKWIGDSEESEWERAEWMLLQRRIRRVWSPVNIRSWSFLLWPGSERETKCAWEIYRHEWIEDARHWSNPGNMFNQIEVQKFIEKSQ